MAAGQGNPPPGLGAERAVQAHKCLTRVERAFRALKLSQLEVRPVYVYKFERGRAQVFLCMLAYYLEWHLRRRPAPMLLQDNDPVAGRARCNSPVDKGEVSDSARRKAGTRITAAGRHSQVTALMLRRSADAATASALARLPGRRAARQSGKALNVR